MNVIEDPCAGPFQMCHASGTLFLVFDEFLIFFLSLAIGGKFIPFAGKQLARLVETNFQPWPPGTLLRDDGRQEHGVRQ